MKASLIVGLFAASGLTVTGCGKSSSTSTDAAVPTDSSGKVPAGTTTKVGSLALVPEIDSFLTSKSTTASLTASMALADRGDGYGLVNGTPPTFTDIQGGLANYLTDDVAAIATGVESDRSSQNWSGMKTKLGKFFDASAKCGVMEHSARMISRLREDTAQLCLLKAVGPIADKVYKVVSGAAIDDLTKVFSPDTTDKVLQIGLTDKGQPHYEIVQIKGSASNPDGYHAVYSTCLSVGKKAFRQNTIDINNKTGLLTFTSYKHGAIDDKGVKPNASFSLQGAVVSDGSGGVKVDTSKARTIAYNGSGTFGQLSSSEQGALTVSDNALKGTFFAAETGKDAAANAVTRSDKSALDVQYSGTGTKDLVIYQGAGRSIIGLTSTIDAATVVNTKDHTIGFTFDSSATPKFTTTTSSTHLTNIAAIDFATDSVLKQDAPTAPDMTAIDSTACSATPTTVLNYVDKPERLGAYADALASCNAFPAEKSGNMCDPLRNKERTINQGMQQRKQATGSATD